jgi:hypothetical protein
MKCDGSDWEAPPEKSEIEETFDYLLFYRYSARMSFEQLKVIKELEHLLSKDQSKFAEYMSDTIHQYKIECEVVLNVGEDDSGPIPEEYQDVYYDKNTTLIQHLYAKRVTILDYLQDIKMFWDNKQIEEIAARLKETHNHDVSLIYNAKKRIEDEFFPLLEKLIMKEIEDSSDTQNNEVLKKSLEDMRNDFKKNGFEV